MRNVAKVGLSFLIVGGIIAVFSFIFGMDVSIYTVAVVMVCTVMLIQAVSVTGKALLLMLWRITEVSEGR